MNKKEVKKAPALRFKGFTNDWEQRKLKEVVNINPSTNVPNTFNYVDLNSVKGVSLIKVKKINKKEAPSRAQRVAKNGDIFYQMVRPYQKNNYLFNKPKTSFPYVFSTGYAQLRSIKTSPSYIFPLLQKSDFVNKVLAHSTGTSYPAINSRDLGQIKIYLPNELVEQNKIGEIFQKINKIIELQQRKLKLLKLLKQGMLQNLFTSKDTPILRFYGFYDILKQYKLSHLFYVNGRIGFRGYTRKDIISKNEGGIWAISPINIQDNCLVSLHNNTYITKAKYEESPEIQLRPSYSLLVKTGSTLGKSAYINNLYEPATINPQIAVLKPINKKISKYLGYILTTDNFLQQITALKIGGAIPTLTERDLKEVKLYIVPDTKEANKISNFLNKLDVIIGFQQKNINNLHQVKKFLFQNMFI